MCSCSNSALDHDLTTKFGEDGNSLKVYSEKFKNKKIVIAPEAKRKKESGDDSDDDQPKRTVTRAIGTQLS